MGKVRFSKVYHGSWSPYMIEHGKHTFNHLTSQKFKTKKELLEAIGADSAKKVGEDWYLNRKGRQIFIPVYEAETPIV